jgi:hypothetical protein
MYLFAIFWYCCLISGGYFLANFGNQVFENHNNFFEFIPLFWIRIFWVLGFYFLNEIIFTFLIYLETRKKINLPTNENEQYDNLEKTVVVIPSHNTNLEQLEKNVENLIKLFPYRIWIAENSNSDDGIREIQEICFRNGIEYVFYNEANKTNAILETVKLIKSKHEHIETIILLDDDTTIPSTFFLRHDLLKGDNIAGYCCNIKVEKNEQSYNFWENWIDFEYQTISFRNCARNIHSLRFLHGIACVYKIDALIEIYKWNPCNIGGLPFGEDAFAGIQARTIGYQLKQDYMNTVKTYCPDKFCNCLGDRSQGYGASSLFKQRALRWYLSWLRRMGNEIGLLFFYDTGSWIGNIMYRLDFIHYCILTIFYLSWIYWIVHLFYNPSSLFYFLILHAGFFVVNIINNYIRIFSMNMFQETDISHKTICTFPIFLIALIYLYLSSFFVSIFYYIPFVRVDYKKCIQKIQ